MAKLLTNVRDIEKAYKAFRKAAYESGEKLRKDFNFKGGEGGKGDVGWHPHLRFWSYFKPYKKSGSWCWNIFGIQDPINIKNLSLTCEINTPLNGTCRSTAGTFVRDYDNRILVVHSGRIGGGKPGIGKAAFWRLFPGEPVSVEQPDKPPFEAAVVTILNEPDATARIAQFVWMVAWIKATAR